MAKKGKKKKKQKVSLEEFDTTPMSKAQLVKLAIRLQQEAKMETEKRGYFMMERDKLRAFWEVTRKQLDDARAQVRDKEHREDDEDMARLSAIKFHEQKILHTMLEQQRKLAELKIENMEVLHQAEQGYIGQVRSLRDDEKKVRERWQEHKEETEDAVKDADMEHTSVMTNIRDEHTLRVAAMSDHYERLNTELRQRLEKRSHEELQALLDRQKAEMDKLLGDNAQARTDLKNYYNEITLNNLSLVASLKAECGELREREERAMQLARSLRAEKRGLAGPLREARDELKELKRQMAHFDRDKADLERAVSRAAAAEKELHDVRWELDVAQILLDKVQEDRDEMNSELTELQARLRLARAHEQMRTERRVRDLHAALEAAHAETAVRQHAGPTCKRLLVLQPLVEEKHKRIATLTLEVARLQKAHEQVLGSLRDALHLRMPHFDDGLRVPPPRAVPAAGREHRRRPDAQQERDKECQGLRRRERERERERERLCHRAPTRRTCECAPDDEIEP